MTVVVDIDRGFKALLRNMIKLRKGAAIEVSAPGRRDDGQSNAFLVNLHEFGSGDGKIPQRSFIRSTIDREKASINKMLDAAVRSGAANGDVRRRLGVAGEKIRGDIIRTIDRSIDIAPNAPSTVAKKGSSTPLVDTGIMKNSLTVKVRGP